MYSPRCPECDIELNCASDKWVCPLCHQTPRPEQYVWSPVQTLDTKPFREIALEAAGLLIETVEDEPALTNELSWVYHKLLEIAERDE